MPDDEIKDESAEALRIGLGLPEEPADPHPDDDDNTRAFRRGLNLSETKEQ